MAYTNGEWLPMRLDLFDDPAILAIAERLDTRVEHVVGYCHRFWSWVSRNATDGKFRGFTPQKLGEVLSLPGFPELLIEVEWLKYSDATKSYVIPNYDRWLGETAKKRLQQRDKKRTQRGQSRDKSGTKSGQKRDVSPRTSQEREGISKDIPLKAASAATSGAPAARGSSASRGEDCTVDPIEAEYQRQLIAARRAGDRAAVERLQETGVPL